MKLVLTTTTTTVRESDKESSQNDATRGCHVGDLSPGTECKVNLQLFTIMLHTHMQSVCSFVCLVCVLFLSLRSAVECVHVRVSHSWE